MEMIKELCRSSNPGSQLFQTNVLNIHFVSVTLQLQHTDSNADDPRPQDGHNAHMSIDTGMDITHQWRLGGRKDKAANLQALLAGSAVDAALVPLLHKDQVTEAIEDALHSKAGMPNA